MFEDFERIEPLLRCPRTGAGLMREETGYRVVDDSNAFYSKVGHKPVLMDFDKSVIAPSHGASGPVDRPNRRGIAALAKRLLSPPKRATRENIDALVDGLPKTRASVVLVIGGGTIGQGMKALYAHPDVRVIAFDVYPSPVSQFIADAHRIPMCDSCVDAVVIQAVLEHVLDPKRVVAEIWRVLRTGGIVYAETPFLQQVHEGAYDFTRFTESGHRYLFRRFDLMRSGVSGGPGTQLIWSIDYFFRGLFRSWLAGKFFKGAFCWLRLFDRLIPTEYASDGASGVFFLGRKSNREMRPREIIDFYPGAQR